MLVKELMTKKFSYVSPDTSIKEAAGRMRDEDLGALPVGENDKLIGMVTDRDIVVRGIANGHDLDHTDVRDVMTTDITYCFDDEDISSASDKMKDQQIRRLVVLNRDKRAVGMVSVGDIAVKGVHELSGSVLNQVCAPA